MKTWYTSKTLWVNLLAIIAIGLQAINANFIISPEIQAGLLGSINLILRAITKQPVDWSIKPSDGNDSEPPHFIPNAAGGFIRLPILPLLFLIACLALVSLSGCATTNQVSPPIASATDNPQQLAGKSLLAVKSTIVTAAISADAFCKAGKMPADQCTQAKAAYETAKPAYDAAVDAYLLMSAQGGDPAAFGAALIRVQSLAANLLLIAGGPATVTIRGTK